MKLQNDHKKEGVVQKAVTDLPDVIYLGSSLNALPDDSLSKDVAHGTEKDLLKDWPLDNHNIPDTEEGDRAYFGRL